MNIENVALKGNFNTLESFAWSDDKMDFHVILYDICLFRAFFNDELSYKWFEEYLKEMKVYINWFKIIEIW